MKAERKISTLPLLINTGLLISIVFSASAAISISLHTGSANYSAWQLYLAIANVITLCVVFVSVAVLVNKFIAQLSYETKHIDALTGFMTRHVFGQVFEHVLLDTKRSLEPLSILMIDIDHFRILNEEHGHLAGDEVLKKLAQSIQLVLRASDITCRWYGDQILVVLKDCTEKDACKLAESMLEIVRQQAIDFNGKSLTITTSIGVAQMVSGDKPETLVSRVETGLHSAHDSGRNCYGVGYDWVLINYYCDPIF